MQEMIVNVRTHNWSDCKDLVSVECSVTNGGPVSHPFSKISGSIVEEGAERLQKLEVWEQWNKTASSGHGRTSKFMNSQ